MIARGTVLIVSTTGGLAGKPRPAIVIQASQYDFPETLIVVPLTSLDVNDDLAMPILLPDDMNGLLEPSCLMTQRIAAVRKNDLGKIIGSMSRNDMERVDAALLLVLGLDFG